MDTNIILPGNALAELKKLPPESIDCVITSPPYWGLRDYGVADQLGLEPDYKDYIANLCNIFDEVYRVLKPTGTCWVNLGDSYAGSGRGFGDKKPDPKFKSMLRGGGRERTIQPAKSDLPAKSLMQIPARFAIAMTDRGWILRNEIIWHKPNAMPQSMKDRFSVDFEKIFFFTKNKKYYFEQQFEPWVQRASDIKRAAEGHKGYAGKHSSGTSAQGIKGQPVGDPNKGRNKRTVWTVSTRPYKGAHFAVYPINLIEPMIKAGCPGAVCRECGTPRQKLYKRAHAGKVDSETGYKDTKSNANNLARMRQAYRKAGSEGPPAPEFAGYQQCDCKMGFEPGIVLDPFFGSGTTGIAAKNTGRQYVGIELNAEYIEIAEKRLAQTLLL